MGYGKTEIALRAAFKAVMGGKQVALPRPDHHPGRAALRDLQGALRAASRCASACCRASWTREGRRRRDRARPRRARWTSSSAPTGSSRRTSRFKDLGLLVVDEEQRFGVKDKERLKELQGQRGLPDPDRHAHPADPAHVAPEDPRHVRPDHAAAATATRSRPSSTEFDDGRSSRGPSGARSSGAARSSTCTTAWRPSTRSTRFLQRLVPEVIGGRGPRPDGRAGARGRDAPLHPRRLPRPACPPPSSRTASTSPTSTPSSSTGPTCYGVSPALPAARPGGPVRTASPTPTSSTPTGGRCREMAMKRLQIISDFTELGSGFKIAMKDLEVRGRRQPPGPGAVRATSTPWASTCTCACSTRRSRGSRRSG
ncbi:MAG: hypothetical protein M0C28_21850 [Candidatus Moduliflexus flocculans]|nr:hypothetical protein [Candidatus Moduliflexus flocculans]